MAQNVASPSTDEETLKSLFDEAMKLFENIENGNEATNSDAVQLNIKRTIAKFEKATNLVSLSGMFSKNEELEELPTETLQYLLLPALLGTLSLKLCGQPRKDVINVAEIYFKLASLQLRLQHHLTSSVIVVNAKNQHIFEEILEDFLQRCKDYGVTDVEVPQTTSSENTIRNQTEQAKIANMILTREAKIKRYKDMKELKEKLATLTKAMSLPSVDDDTKRQYFTTLLLDYVNQALDELSSIEQEKPILEYMSKHAGEHKQGQRERAPPLRPVIITRDAVQKAVFGAGYPSLPTMSIEEFYDKRVREGLFPGSGTNIPHATIQNAEAEPDETEEVAKERLVEEDDPEEMARQRYMDEYKDDHRRGWGNRHNRS